MTNTLLKGLLLNKLGQVNFNVNLEGHKYSSYRILQKLTCLTTLSVLIVMRG